MERSFSEREGLHPPRQIQSSGMDRALRHSIWNLFYSVFESSDWATRYWPNFAEALAIGFFKVPADQVPRHSDSRSREWLFKHYQTLDWPRVYDLLEFVAVRPGLYKETGKVKS